MADPRSIENHRRAMMEAHKAIERICPIVGISAPDGTSTPADWKIEFSHQASTSQRADAQALLKSFAPAPSQEPVPSPECLARLLAWAKTKGFKG